MGLLVGLPLKLFSIVFVALRFLWPVLLLLLALWLVKKLRARQYEPRQEKTKEPEFDGPVYTVDYEDVPEDEP